MITADNLFDFEQKQALPIKFEDGILGKLWGLIDFEAIVSCGTFLNVR